MPPRNMPKVIPGDAVWRLECKKTFQQPGLCLAPGPSWGSLQHSPRLHSCWGPKNLTPSLGPLGLVLTPSHVCTSMLTVNRHPWVAYRGDQMSSEMLPQFSKLVLFSLKCMIAIYIFLTQHISNSHLVTVERQLQGCDSILMSPKELPTKIDCVNQTLSSKFNSN